MEAVQCLDGVATMTVPLKLVAAIEEKSIQDAGMGFPLREGTPPVPAAALTLQLQQSLRQTIKATRNTHLTAYFGVSK